MTRDQWKLKYRAERIQNNADTAARLNSPANLAAYQGRMDFLAAIRQEIAPQLAKLNARFMAEAVLGVA